MLLLENIQDIYIDPLLPNTTIASNTVNMTSFQLATIDDPYRPKGQQQKAPLQLP